MIRRALILLLCAFCASCSGGRTLSIGKPYALDTTPPPGSALFKKGWKEGCNSGLAGMGNQLNKLFFSFEYDTSLADNVVYERAWKSGNLYCRVFVYTGYMHDSGNFGEKW